MNQENINDDQIRQEVLKYGVGKFSIKFSKTLAKELRAWLQSLENKRKLDEQNLECFENEDHLRSKLRIEETQEVKANGVKIKSKCAWCKYGEKSSKFFLNFEKNPFFRCHIYKLTIEEKN